MKENREKRWYALITKPKAERLAELELINKGIETYLPREKRLKIVKNRRKWTEAPLISNYIFVCITEKEKEIVRFTNGIGGFVSFSGEVPPVPDTQILSLRIMLDENINFIRTNEHFSIGDYVTVLRRDLMGIEGKLVQYRGKKKVLLELSNLQAAFMIDVPIKYLQKKAA